MKTILCFGDSNTWGFDPVGKSRFPGNVRWTGVLQRELESEYKVIEEGLNGRTTVWNDPTEVINKNGRDYLPACLESHMPIDLVIIMLGTNDLKNRFSASALDISSGLGVLINIVRRSPAGHHWNPPDHILILCPPAITKLTEYADMFIGAEEKSKQLPEQYRRVAEAFGCKFLDTSKYIRCSDLDGIHFEAGEHLKLGKAVAGYIREFL